MSRLSTGPWNWVVSGVFVLLCAVGAQAQPDFYVDAAATGNNDGSEWEHAFTDVQSALEQAESGDEIWVAAGTYFPSEEYCVDCGTPDGNHATFNLPDGVRIYGGFLGNAEGGDEDDRQQRNPEVNETILSGDLPGTGTARHVVTADEVSSSTVLSGFTITAGAAGGSLGSADEWGGGLLIYADRNGESSPHVTRCKFMANSAGFGGGVAVHWSRPYMAAPAPVFFNCIFENNLALRLDGSRGGGVAVRNAPSLFVDCIFYANLAEDGLNGRGRGGGLYVLCESSPTCKDCGGVTDPNCVCHSTEVTNCVFYDNEARDGTGLGGGVYADGCDPNDTILELVLGIHNSILWENLPNQITGASAGDANTPSLIVEYSDIEFGWPGTGNISADPLFCNAAGGDFRLDIDSPCIDAGLDSHIPQDGVDLDDDGNVTELLPFDAIKQEPRIVDSIPSTSNDVDMGAIENPHKQNCVEDLDDSGAVALPDLAQVISCFGTTDCISDVCCIADLDCDADVDLEDLAQLLSAFGNNCGFTPVEGELVPSISPWNTGGYSGGGFEGEDEHFVFDALIEIDEEDDDWTVSGTVITATNGAAFRLAPVDPNTDVPIPGSSEPDKYATFFSVPKNVNTNGRFNNPMGDDGAIAGACHPIAPDYTFTTTSITACWYDKDGDSNDGPAAVLRVVIDVSGVSGADTSGGFGSVYFSTSGPTGGGDIMVADFGLATAHAAEGGELATVMGAFYVTGE